VAQWVWDVLPSAVVLAVSPVSVVLLYLRVSPERECSVVVVAMVVEAVP
jgi:hypothetical protein